MRQQPECLLFVVINSDSNILARQLNASFCGKSRRCHRDIFPFHQYLKCHMKYIKCLMSAVRSQSANTHSVKTHESMTFLSHYAMTKNVSDSLTRKGAASSISQRISLMPNNHVPFCRLIAANNGECERERGTKWGDIEMRISNSCGIGGYPKYRKFHVMTASNLLW